MERRHFLKIAFGFAAGAVALAAGAEAEAAPLTPQPLIRDLPPGGNEAQPAVTTGDEADRVAPEQVRWGRGRRWGWRGRRRWGWRGVAVPGAFAAVGAVAVVTGAAATGKRHRSG